jgi:acetylornithine/N-succinyldiaminopimelate aminotransferase
VNNSSIQQWTNRLMGNYGVPPVTFVRGSGTELFDDAGNRYLDFLCGLAVTGLGHAHPRVATALAEQASTLLHVSNLFVTEPQLEVQAGFSSRTLAPKPTRLP